MSYLTERILYPSLLSAPPASDLYLAVTIPCYNETNAADTLRSLAACQLPKIGSVEVLLLVNHGTTAPNAVRLQNEKAFDYLFALAPELSRAGLRFHVLKHFDLPARHAGVGLARKILMDEAYRRLHLIGRTDGVIACLDADSQVDPNYLSALASAFQRDQSARAASIYYEHPTEGSAYSEGVYRAIIAYELHLRYYVHALRMAGLPGATQTVGSSMAVRAEAYARQGGMNRRKAGEDFYFLHKFTGQPGFRELVCTRVIPSPRLSDRVPFGTGKAVKEIVSGSSFMTYNPLTFAEMKAFLTVVDAVLKEDRSKLPDISHLQLETHLHPASVAFLREQQFHERWVEIQTKTTRPATRQKRFYQWFDAFRAMKMVHALRDRAFPSMTVGEAVTRWANLFTEWDDLPNEGDENGWLRYFRTIDRALSAVPDEFRVRE